MVTIRCPECRHKWNYRGSLGTVWCASCGKRIKISERGNKKANGN